jgi:hypothetical protein
VSAIHLEVGHEPVAANPALGCASIARAFVGPMLRVNRYKRHVLHSPINQRHRPFKNRTKPLGGGKHIEHQAGAATELAYTKQVDAVAEVCMAQLAGVHHARNILQHKHRRSRQHATIMHTR